MLASAGVCLFLGREGAETDLLSLVGRRGTLVAALAEKSSSQIRVLCPDARATEVMREAFAFDEPVEATNVLALVRTHGKGLLSAKHRAQLLAGETNKIARSALRRDYAGVGLFPKADDPYYFLNDFAMDFRAFAPRLPEGATLLTADVRGHEAELPAFVFAARKWGSPALSGAPFHALKSAQATKFQISVLGGLSLVAVLLIGLWLFGNGRFILPLALALGAGFLVASAAVFLLPGRPHVLTFLFGTTLIGLGVDYCYHALMREATASPRFARRLSAALATTCLAFSPLFFSTIAVLREMAVFTVAGLVTIYAFVLLFPLGRVRRADAFGSDGPTAVWLTIGGKGALLAKTAFAALVVAGCLRVTFANDPAAFYRMPARLAADEAKVAAALGYADARLALVDWDAFAAWQRENAALKAKMGVEPTGEFLAADDLPPSMTLAVDGRDYLVLPAPMANALAPGLAHVVDARAELQKTFDALALETIRLAAVAFAVLALALLLIFRRRFLAFAVPVVLALDATVAALGWLGAPVNVFQILCFFVLVGLGIDYVIFHKSEFGTSPPRVVFASFLTSFVSFGLLAFTTFPVTRSMGITLALGLLFAYLFSLPTARDVDRLLADLEKGNASTPDDWANQPQRGAGRLRLWALYLVYRVFGKTAAKGIAAVVVCCVYPWARPVRAALADFARRVGTDPKKAFAFKVMLNFAWSMVDKMDACGLARDVPRLTVEGDADWMKGGCFLLATHVGCIEVLPALGVGKAAAPHVHAFQQMGRDALYTSFFLRHLDRSRLTLHAVEEIGVETAVEMKDAVARGEIVLMAADRLPAHDARTPTLEHAFLGAPCAFPKGVFRFAKLMECPVYAIVCVRTGWNAYAVRARRLKAEDVPGGYVAFLEEAARRDPEQWYQFYDFFREGGGER